MACSWLLMAVHVSPMQHVALVTHEQAHPGPLKAHPYFQAASQAFVPFDTPLMKVQLILHAKPMSLLLARARSAQSGCCQQPRTGRARPASARAPHPQAACPSGRGCSHPGSSAGRPGTPRLAGHVGNGLGGQHAKERQRCGVFCRCRCIVCWPLHLQCEAVAEDLQSPLRRAGTREVAERSGGAPAQDGVARIKRLAQADQRRQYVLVRARRRCIAYALRCMPGHMQCQKRWHEGNCFRQALAATIPRGRPPHMHTLHILQFGRHMLAVHTAKSELGKVPGKWGACKQGGAHGTARRQPR